MKAGIVPEPAALWTLLAGGAQLVSRSRQYNASNALVAELA